MDTIEREIVIAAPIERVWEIVTTPSTWAAGSATPEPSATATSSRCAGRSTASAELRVVRDEPPNALRLPLGRERPRASATRSSSSRFTPEGDGTRVRVVESGWAHCDDRRRARAAARGQRRRLGARARRPGALRADRGRVTEDVFTALADPTRRRGPRPAGGARARHGDHPGRRAAREPPGGDQASRRPRPRRPGRRAAARSRGAVRRPARAAAGDGGVDGPTGGARGTRGSTRSAPSRKSE